MSMVELADKVGILKQTMYKYENDVTTNIPSDKIELIADALGVSPAAIMGWKDAPFGEDLDRSEKEETIISLFRLLSDEQKQLVTNLIESLAVKK